MRYTRVMCIAIINRPIKNSVFRYLTNWRKKADGADAFMSIRFSEKWIVNEKYHVHCTWFRITKMHIKMLLRFVRCRRMLNEGIAQISIYSKSHSNARNHTSRYNQHTQKQNPCGTLQILLDQLMIIYMTIINGG